jgi:hypothetical protein
LTLIFKVIGFSHCLLEEEWLKKKEAGGKKIENEMGSLSEFLKFYTQNISSSLSSPIFTSNAKILRNHLIKIHQSANIRKHVV